ncbi:MAG: hypothetical protein WBE26_16575, partial [Phycisphaerae bacterium]
ALEWNTESKGSLEDREKGERVSLSNVRAVWWFDFPEPRVSGLDIEPEHIEWAKYETRNGLRWILTSLDACYMSHPDAIDAASLKTVQLQTARELGLRIPRTIISNMAGGVRQFVERRRQVVFKTISPLSRERSRKSRAILTTLVDASAIDDRALGVKLNMFQEFVSKVFDVRTTVVGDTTFSARIESQASEQTSVDWRRYDIANTPHFPHELPFDVSRRCIALTKRLNLRYGAIDFAVTSEGEYFFLEINPVGLWLWLEGLTGQPISHAIARELIAMSQA